MKIKQILFSIIALVACIGSLTGCDSKPEVKVSGKTVKIGFIAPFSGEDEEWGHNGLLGNKTALEMQPYLLQGDKPEMIIADDQNKPELTRKVLKKLVEVDQVSAILILSGSEAVLAAAELADYYKTPILALLATHPDVTNNDYISQLVFDDITQGTVGALYVMDEMFIDHVAVFKDPTDPHSSFLADEFTRKFEEIGGVVEKVTIAKEKNDYSGILQRLYEMNLDFLYLPLDADQVIEIEKMTRKIDWNPQVMVSDGLISAILLQFEDDLKYMDGMLATDIYSTILPKTDYGKSARNIFKQSFDAPRTTFTGLACEGTSILLAAMDKCSDSSDRDCINKMLRNTEDFTGLFGKIQINQNGKAERPIFINIIDDKNQKFVVKVY